MFIYTILYNASFVYSCINLEELKSSLKSSEFVDVLKNDFGDDLNGFITVIKTESGKPSFTTITTNAVLHGSYDFIKKKIDNFTLEEPCIEFPS